MWCLATPLLLTVLGVCSLLALNLWARLRAEAILREVRKLRVGQSTLADVIPIVKRLGGTQTFISNCGKPNPFGYSLKANKEVLTRFIEQPWLRRIGLHAWRGLADLEISDGKLCHLAYEIQVFHEDRMLEWIVWESDGKEAGAVQDYPSYFPQVDTVAGTGVRIVSATLKPNAAAEDYEHSFDFNLSCLTSFKGCQIVCEVMPSTWRVAVLKRRIDGLIFPPDDVRAADLNLDDPRCSIRRSK